MEYTVYQFNMYFVYYYVTTCTNISYSNMRMREALSALFVPLVYTSLSLKPGSPHCMILFYCCVLYS